MVVVVPQQQLHHNITNLTSLTSRHPIMQMKDDVTYNNTNTKDHIIITNGFVGCVGVVVTYRGFCLLDMQPLSKRGCCPKQIP